MGAENQRPLIVAHFRAALQPFEELARIVVIRRAELGLTQHELAARMGSTKSVISHPEWPAPNQHGTLCPLAEALGGHVVVGFQFGDEPARELVLL